MTRIRVSRLRYSSEPKSKHTQILRTFVGSSIATVCFKRRYLLDYQFAMHTLDQLNAASVRYRISIGPGAGQRTFTLRDPALAQPTEQSVPKPFTVNRDGFSPNAAVAAPHHHRDGLEHLCRYITRPALCLERLSLHTDGRIRLRLKRPFRDGTTHILFTPADFMARLAALIPRPRHNLTRYRRM